MPDPSSDRDPVETLATEFVERIRRGELPTVTQYAEEGGYSYIVMQLIPGVGLDEILLQLAESQQAESAETNGQATASGAGSPERIAEAADSARMLVRSDIEHAAGPDIAVCSRIKRCDTAAASNGVATEIARIYNSLGDLQIMAGAPDASRSFHVDALKILDRLATASVPPPAVRYELARTCYFLGRGAPPDMTPTAQRPGPHPPLGVPPPPDRTQHKNEPHPPLGGLPPGPLRDRPGPPPPDRIQRENEPYLLRAIGLLEKLAEQQPAIPDYQHLLARCYRELLPAKLSGPDTARVGQTKWAIEILEKLVENFPSVPGYRHDLAKSYFHHFSQLPPGSIVTGESQLRKALDIAEKLVAEHPNVPNYAASQAHNHFVLSEILRHDVRFCKLSEVCGNAQTSKFLRTSHVYLVVLAHNHAEPTFAVHDDTIHLFVMRFSDERNVYWSTLLGRPAKSSGSERCCVFSCKAKVTRTCGLASDKSDGVPAVADRSLVRREALKSLENESSQPRLGRLFVFCE